VKCFPDFVESCLLNRWKPTHDTHKLIACIDKLPKTSHALNEIGNQQQPVDCVMSTSPRYVDGLSWKLGYHETKVVQFETKWTGSYVPIWMTIYKNILGG